MFNHYYGMSLLNKRIERSKQFFNIMKMQAGGRFIKNKTGYAPVLFPLPRKEASFTRWPRPLIKYQMIVQVLHTPGNARQWVDLIDNIFFVFKKYQCINPHSFPAHRKCFCLYR